jgi:hypothetical protein
VGIRLKTALPEDAQFKSPPLRSNQAPGRASRSGYKRPYVGLLGRARGLCCEVRPRTPRVRGTPFFRSRRRSRSTPSLAKLALPSLIQELREDGASSLRITARLDQIPSSHDYNSEVARNNICLEERWGHSIGGSPTRGNIAAISGGMPLFDTLPLRPY